jgi:hypothetical protein
VALAISAKESAFHVTDYNEILQQMKQDSLKHAVVRFACSNISLGMDRAKKKKKDPGTY